MSTLLPVRRNGRRLGAATRLALCATLAVVAGTASPALAPATTAPDFTLHAMTGPNLQLNQNTPWPKLSLAVPCSQAHTAEVFYANNSFWSKNTAFPGDQTIQQTASTEAIGDGKIFVLDLASATRIRTGETGDTAL